MRTISASKISKPIFTALLLLTIGFVNCKINGVKVESTLLDSNAITSKKIMLGVKISNFSGGVMQVPETFMWGLKNDPYADFILEIEEKNGSSNFVHYDIPDNYHPQFTEEVIRKLGDKDCLSDSFNIAIFYGYRFPMGVYRARVVYKISRYNSFTDIPSNWVDFTIK